MPHSTRTSAASDHTFTLDDPFPPPSSSSPVSPMVASTHSRNSSSFGLALTSNPLADGRAALPSHQHHHHHHQKRDSTINEDAYALLVGNNNNNNENMASRPSGDRSSMRNSLYGEATRRRSQYYEDQYKYKDSSTGLARDKVVRHSPLIAELKTNVIIKDEFTLVTDLSYHLAQRYSRPESCIMIKVDHSACLALGGTFDPCYMLSIDVLSSQLSPGSNRRNAALIQAFMSDILSVPAERGVVKFQATTEDCLATNGNTIQGEVERLDRQQVEEPSALKRVINGSNRKSMPSFSTRKSDTRINGLNGVDASISSSSRTPPPAPGSAADNLFGPSSAGTDKDIRPSTSHGSHISADMNGLRMNGISVDQWSGKNARLANGRPKTLGAEPSSIQDELKSQPLPTAARVTTQRSDQPRKSLSRAGRPSSTATTSAATTTTSSAPRSSALKPTAHLPAEIRAKNTYLDNTSTLTSKQSDAASRDSSRRGDDSASANTARRRSTITATPKMPSSNSIPHGPPAIPPDLPKPDSKSTKSLKIGKRKSFMSVIRRTWRDDTSVKG